MKRYFLATLATMALAGGSANAADLARPMPRVAPAPVAAVYKWTGPYFGVTVGYSWGRLTTDRTATFAPIGFPGAVTVLNSESQDVDGIVGGVTSGINWQFGAWVWGLEHDISASGQEGETTVPFLTPVGTINITADHKLKWFGTARSRLGFLWADWVLVYATAGVAYGQLTSDFTLTATGVVGPLAALNFKSTRAGYTIGGGIEGAFGGGWSGRARVPLHRSR